MTSLLAFAWRKANSASTSSSSMPSAPSFETDFHHPGVTASSSGETLSNPFSSDSLFGTSSTTSCIAGPYTPDALRVRRSPQEIREELGLPPKRLIWEQENVACASPACSALPPMFGTCGTVPSPQVSISSFYSRTSGSIRNLAIAESPNLKVGHAKTAVGALLALNDSKANNPPMSPCHGTSGLPQEKAILPSRAWLEDDRSIDDNDFSLEILPYESLNDSQGCFSPKSCGFRDGNLSDEDCSIHASPSSNRHQGYGRNLPNTSFTRAFLQADTSHLSENDRYDFHPIVDKELIVSDEPDKLMNVSCMSQSTVKEMESLCSMGGDFGPPEVLSNKNAPNGESLFRTQNDRRIKEDLLLSTLERLQDDNDIVLDVMDAIKETRGQWDVSMRPGEDNLFSGFKQSVRLQILKNIDAQIGELRAQGNFDHDLVDALSFCRSLVHAAVPTAEKVASVQNCNSAFVPQQTHRWRRIAGFRGALGFDEVPQSPQTVRGGDTSLFSLPSESANDATPHTSNVSMTSTITSAVSPDRGTKRSNHFLRRGNVRESMETVCTSFDALSAECVKMAENQMDDLEVARAMHHVYRQMLTIANDDLKALIDSFELDLISISRLVSHDTDDEEDERVAPFLNQPFPLVRSWAPTNDSGTLQQQLVSQTMALSLQPIDINIVEDEEREARENLDLYSPNTLDMESILSSSVAGTPDSMEDDLRRTVGSFDRDDDVVEEREAAPPMDFQDQAMRGKWGKGRLNIFKRRTFRRRQAAE